MNSQSLLHRVRQFINGILYPFGLRLIRRNAVEKLQFQAMLISQRAAFNRLIQHTPALGIATIIDVGASDGRWSKANHISDDYIVCS